MTADRRNQRQMAEARVDAAERQVHRAMTRLQNAEEELEAAKKAKKTAEAALHYAQQHPLLVGEIPTRDAPAG